MARLLCRERACAVLGRGKRSTGAKSLEILVFPVLATSVLQTGTILNIRLNGKFHVANLPRSKAPLVVVSTLHAAT